MDRWERQKREFDVVSNRDEWLAVLAADGLRSPDTMSHSHAKWDEGTTYVIIRFDLVGGATFDAGWVEADGQRNGMVAPRPVTNMTGLAGAIQRMLVHPRKDSIPTRPLHENNRAGGISLGPGSAAWDAGTSRN